MTWQILQGDAMERLRELDSESVQTCVTSPPYWGLRDYGNDGQLGLEPTPEEYVANLVAVFREVRRVLRDDGTVWLNLGDSYNSIGHKKSHSGFGTTGLAGGIAQEHSPLRRENSAPGLKHKDLVGIPWRVAFALQADGWWLRSDIIWAKPNPMPESVTDRPTRAHEYLFLLSKQSRYFYDAEAIREEDAGITGGRQRAAIAGDDRYTSTEFKDYHNGRTQRFNGTVYTGTRNKRSVWIVTTQPYPEAHFATFPPKLVEPCILAGSPPKCCGECGAPWERVTDNEQVGWRADRERNVGGRRDGFTSPSGAGPGFYSHRETLGWRPTCAEGHRSNGGADRADDSGHSVVLDPFAGSGTTGVVALRHDRSFVGIELSPEYCEMARNRIRDDAPLLNTQLEAA